MPGVHHSRVVRLTFSREQGWAVLLCSLLSQQHPRRKTAITSRSLPIFARRMRRAFLSPQVVYLQVKKEEEEEEEEGEDEEE